MLCVTLEPGRKPRGLSEQLCAELLRSTTRTMPSEEGDPPTLEMHPQLSQPRHLTPAPLSLPCILTFCPGAFSPSLLIVFLPSLQDSVTFLQRSKASFATSPCGNLETSAFVALGAS